MDIIGKSVMHISFGKGVITGVSESIVHISFQSGNKKFLFPDSFLNFIVFEDTEEQKKIKAQLRRKELEEKKKDNAFREAHERLQRLNNLKIIPNSQGVFGLIANTAGEIFSTWSIFTGRYVSGYSKGEPRIPARLAPNSVCLLTCLPKGLPEQERKIIGAFMTRDDFYGTECFNGIIKAHDDYRIKLEDSETLFYWSYFNIGDTPPSWGGVEIKYCSGSVVRKILFDIRAVAVETPRFEKIDCFYRYFCNINRIDNKLKAKSKDKESNKIKDKEPSALGAEGL